MYFTLYFNSNLSLGHVNRQKNKLEDRKIDITILKLNKISHFFIKGRKAIFFSYKLVKKLKILKKSRKKKLKNVIECNWMRLMFDHFVYLSLTSSI